MAVHDNVFAGDGEMARLMRQKNWAATPLGPVDRWPQALRTAVDLLLTSRFEMWLGWGEQIHFFYNDAYRPTLGSKHPHALGMPTQELWSEIWSDVAPRLRQVYAEGVATWDSSLLLLLHRNGYREETYHTFSYSPLRDDDGRVGGVFCAVTEDTERVISQRRIACLGQLGSELAGADGVPAILAAANRAFRANAEDLPFVLVYRFEPDGRAVLDTRLPDSGEGPWAPVAIEVSDTAAPWPLGRLWHHASDRTMPAPAVDLPHGPWQIPPREVALLPVAGTGTDRPAGVVVVGLNPHRPFDRLYREFLVLAVGQIAARLASSAAAESERRRAAALLEALELRQAAADRLREAHAQLERQAQVHAAENQRLHELFEQAPSFMCILEGPEHVFTLVNEAYRQLVGHRDLIGMPVREALPDLQGQGYFELLDEVLATGRPFVGKRLQVLVQRRSGDAPEERILNLVYQPIFAPDRSVRGIFVDGYDMTDQRDTEDELLQLNATLEQRVAERTHQLEDALASLERESAQRESAQEALRHSQRMESLGQLTGGVAHDFNNILQVIGANLELLGKDVSHHDKATGHVRNALNGVLKGAKLASQLLSFGRKQPLEPKVVHIGRFVRAVDDMLRRSLGEEVELETVIAGGLWNVLVDRSQLENAMLNLAINARDAMDGNGRLTIEAGNAMLDDAYARQHQDLKPGQYVMLAVTDTGSGIAAEHLDRVFEPFFSTKPEGKGTGLGLSMVYGFVKQSGGHVKIYSEVGNGTTIRLYLPRVHEEEDPVPDTSFADLQGGQETLLVVEDDDDVREAAVGLLQELGYRVYKARDAASAWAIIESGLPVDLLFTDVVMPGAMRSPELARRARERIPGLAVLFTSGYTENAIVHGGRLDRGVDLLSKPYTRDALGKKVRHVLAGRAQAAVPTPAAADPRPVGAGRVLLVEDDADVRTVLAEIVDAMGYEVQVAADATEALAAFEPHRTHAVITDVGLPGTSGIELVRQLRERDDRVPVVFVTGDARDPRLGAFARAVTLVKPVAPERLLTVLRSWQGG